MRRQQKAILLIVLMLVGSANAYPVLSFVDEGQTITTTLGSIVRLEVETDEPAGEFFATIDVDGDAIITGAINKSDCADYGWDPASRYTHDTEGIGTTSVLIQCHVDGYNSESLVGYVEITYGSGSVTVSGTPYGVPPIIADFSDGVVTIVPEPATLLLLASGTLILLRKRRH